MFSNLKTANRTEHYSYGLEEAAIAVRKGDLSSEDFTRSLLERIQAHEEKVQAFQWIDFSRAVYLACLADEKQRSGSPLGPLHGIGVGIKDIIETKEIPTTMGSAVYEDFVPERSAAVVRRLEAAGAFVMGKTVTSEFAFFTPGKTRNPWNPAHTPGGSSSGSAAAVAMGFTPAAIGTQTNGSVIRPAAIYGPGRSILERMRQGLPVPADSGPVYRVHVEDLARICFAALEQSDFPSPINALDLKPASSLEVAQWVHQRHPELVPKLEEGYLARRGFAVHPERKLSNQRLLETQFTFVYPSYQEGMNQ